MIEVNDLHKEFAFKRKGVGVKQSLKSFIKSETCIKEAVKDVSFNISEGEIVGFLGPNGAGKTTTLKMLSGILFPTSGNISVLGYSPWERKNDFKRQISIVLGQKNQLWWDLPASESLYLNKCIYGIGDKAYRQTLDELCDLLQVQKLLDIQVRNLSLGERMKMELVAALLHKPKIIFLDEPTIGLDMIAQKNIRDFLKYYNQKEKTTIMLTSHYLEDIENLCERAIVINHGTIVYDGKLKTINDKLAQKKIVKIKTQDHYLNSDDERWRVRKIEDGLLTLEIDKNVVQKVITELLSKYDIKDFSVEDIPLEESLELLYR
ncbi:multidrug ABC transporter ATP-binding protein [Enterocloster clostridioformis]|nr:multidrug ABC transporter ATP-binding protein [Lachnoclostridium sp. YL32]NDO28476.1 ATP-binding cassette domain-containing protein [Enterocloster clostridioformis]OXE70905.1 multidrug ABC transporter ATP-binding protein [Enterocloster clostridioformis]QQR01062.1 ABC transporter ATP-binding protein [Enterocloster clostridioformis]